MKSMKASKCVKISNVFPPDTNNHNSMFGGKLMGMIDDIASLAAKRHSRSDVVTVSTDSVDFLRPIRSGDAVYLESYVTYTGQTSMEVFIKIITENYKNWLTTNCSYKPSNFCLFMTCGRPTKVPAVYPETDEERKLYASAASRANLRKERRKASSEWAEDLSI